MVLKFLKLNEFLHINLMICKGFKLAHKDVYTMYTERCIQGETF